MKPIYKEDGETLHRVELETMDDVAMAEAAIVVARSHSDDPATKEYQQIGQIQTVSLVSNPEHLPLPLGVQQSQQVIEGLGVSADHEVRHGHLFPEAARELLGQLGVREVIEPRFQRTSIPVLRLVEPELALAIQRLQETPEPTAA